MWSPWFLQGFVSTTGLESVSKANKVLKIFSFCGGSVRFFPYLFKVARLQSEFCTKDFLFELRIFLRKMLRDFPRKF